MPRKLKAKKKVAAAPSKKVTKVAHHRPAHHEVHNWRAIALVAMVVATGLLIVLVSYMSSIRDIVVQGKIMP